MFEYFFYCIQIISFESDLFEIILDSFKNVFEKVSINYFLSLVNIINIENVNISVTNQLLLDYDYRFN